MLHITHTSRFPGGHLIYPSALRPDYIQSRSSICNILAQSETDLRGEFSPEGSIGGQANKGQGFQKQGSES